MADIQWVKLTTDMFDNRKIKHLRRLPEGNSVVLIWVMLLTMAGRCNAGGMIFLTENIPYTIAILADELGFAESTVQMALEAFEKLDMIVMNGDFFSVAGWEEYQNIEGMDKIREQNRLRKQRQRERERLLICEGNVMSRDSHAIEEDKEEEIEEEKEIDIEKGRRERVDYMLIVDLFNRLCPSLPSVKTLSEGRKKAIKARMNVYSVEDFQRLFEMAEQSDFLKGSNGRNWQANFDWLIKDSNMAKVLEGNYENKGRVNSSSSAQELNNFYNMAADWAQG